MYFVIVIALVVGGAALLVKAHAHDGLRGLVLMTALIELVVLYRPLADEYFWGPEGGPVPGFLTLGVPPLVAALVVAQFSRTGRHALVTAVSAASALIAAIPSFIVGCYLASYLELDGCFS